MKQWIPEDILKKYDVANYNHAAEILSQSFPEEFSDVIYALRQFAFSTKDSDLSNKLIPHRDIISIFSHPLMFIVRANNHGFFSDLMNSCKTTHRCLSIERRKSMTCFHHYLYNIIEGYLMTAITHYCITRMIDCS